MATQVATAVERAPALAAVAVGTAVEPERRPEPARGAAHTNAAITVLYAGWR